jgi:3-dehydroquinate dehydratase/shikimate dehydrogenase
MVRGGFTVRCKLSAVPCLLSAVRKLSIALRAAAFYDAPTRKMTDSMLESVPTAAPVQTPLSKICIALQADTPAELLACAERALADSSFLEFRLDALDVPSSALATLAGFLKKHPEVTAVGTCRRRPGGGAFDGAIEDEFEILAQAAAAGCRIVDLEIESAEAAKPEQVEALKERLHAAGAELLISFHDFQQTHNLEIAARRIAVFQPEFAKVVSTARRLADNLPVLRMIEAHSKNTRFVGIAMGEEGIVSRVLGPRSGSAFTFASAGSGVETAPGQVTASTLRGLYRLEEIDAETRVFGVAGNPIAHSLSPLMQNAAFAAEGVNAVLLPLKAREVGDLLSLLCELPLAGCAVTMPFKLEVLPYLATKDPLVARIGACNTLRVGGNGAIEGFNTDVAGIVRPLQKRLELKGARIALLGAGGAARAAAFGLVEEGAEVFLVNRTHATAVALAQECGATALTHAEFAAREFDVLLNSTPCGMKDAAQPLPIAANELHAALVFDMVYNPLQTPLLKLAASRGIATIGGIEMFVQQGICQFELWTGKTAPEEVMFQTVEAALKARQ